VSGAARDSSRKEGPQEDPGGTRAGIEQDSEPGSAPLTSRAGAARRFAGRGTLAQNPQTLLRLQRTYGNAMVQRLLAPAPAQTAGPGKKPTASDVIAADYPHLAKVLTSKEMGQIQKVLDAMYRIGQLDREFETRFPGAERFDAENAPRIEAIRREREEQGDIAYRNRDLFVKTELVLAEDVLLRPQEKPEEGSSDTAMQFREQLYSLLISSPTRIRIQPEALEDRSEPLVKLIWGPNNWEMTHQGGLITFRDLLQIQKFSMPYMLALQGRKAELELGILEGQRKAGRIMPGMEKKKLGEIYDPLNNKDVRISWERGRISGYAPDPSGELEMYVDLRQIEGARAVLVGPGGFLHIFSLKPSFKTWDLTTPLGEEKGTLHLLDVERQVPEVFLIETADHVTLRPGGKGWWTTGEELDITTRFAMGAILGDAIEDPSISSIIGQIVIGLIPVVGQIADARDVAIGIHKMWSTGGKDGKVQTLLAAVGFVPLFGDALKAALKGGKQGIRALKEVAPTIEKQLARELIQSPERAAARFGLTKAELQAWQQSFQDLAKEALKEGGAASTKYARAMAEHLDFFKGDAGALVAAAGGKWTDVTKGLAKAAKDAADKEAREVAEATLERMQAWRREQVRVMQQTLEEQTKRTASALGKKPHKPNVQATGTDKAISDLDMSFLGPTGAADRLAAIRYMERTFGKGWRDLLDADIFVDPSRLHMFTELGGKTRAGVEGAVLEQQKLNVLAKMALQGAPQQELARHAKTLGIDLEALAARRTEVAELTVSKMIMDGAPAKEIEAAAKKMGVDPTKLDPNLFRRTELDMDALHQRFLDAKTVPEKAEIAKEMAIKQSLLDSAHEGAYSTSGGVAKEVSRRGGMGGSRAGAYTKMTPTMGLEHVIDQLPMLQATWKKIAKRGGVPDVAAAKALAKYADRILVTAGQYEGAWFGPVKGMASVELAEAMRMRALFHDVQAILAVARAEPSRILEMYPILDEAMKLLDGRLDWIIKNLKHNADEYLRTGGDAGVVKELAAVEKGLIDQLDVVRGIWTGFRGAIGKEQKERKTGAAVP
jgi:hypothetical protein